MKNDMTISDEDAIITDKHLDNAIISFLCGLAIALAILVSACMRGCHPAPATPDFLCEECGQIIAETDHGHCQTDNVYVRAIIDPIVAQANLISISSYVTNENGVVYFAVRGTSCE